MKAIMPSVPPEVLAFRKRTGSDRWDEMWKGVLHMPPAPNPDLQELEWALETYLRSRWARQHDAKKRLELLDHSPRDPRVATPSPAHRAR